MKILITGSNGFVGKNLVAYLRDNTDHELFLPNKDVLNLLDASRMMCGCCLEDIVVDVLISYLINNKIDAIIHLAGVVGGIGFNKDNQGKLLFDNLQIGMNILEAAHLSGGGSEYKSPKVIILGTTCSYPHTPKTIPFIEEELFDGMPEITNSGYGIAKRTLVKMGMEYASQYGLKVVNLIPTNMIGEHDHFDEDKSHVVPALIKKFENPQKAIRRVPCDCDCHKDKNIMHFIACCDNNRTVPGRREDAINAVQLWGTGSASRDFLYVGDCVKAIHLALTQDVGPEPINLASGKEITIKQLAETIKKVGKYDSEISWNSAKPDGQPRRCLDVSRAKKVLGWEVETSLEQALAKTIEWYRNNK